MTIESDNATYHIGVLARVYGIIDAVSKQPRTVSELVAVLDANSRTLYRLVRNLEAEGYVRRLPNEPNRWALGFKVLQLGERARRQMNLRDLVTPVLQQLVESTGETAFLSVRDGNEAVFIRRVEGTSPLRLSVEEGSRRSLAVGAASKVLCAYAPPDVVSAVFSEDVHRADGTPIVEEAYLRELQSVRDAGFASSSAESTAGASAIAAPVFDPQGEILAAVSIGGATASVLGAGAEHRISMVKAAAATISELIGGSQGSQ